MPKIWTVAATCKNFTVRKTLTTHCGSTTRNTQISAGLCLRLCSWSFTGTSVYESWVLKKRLTKLFWCKFIKRRPVKSIRSKSRFISKGPCHRIKFSWAWYPWKELIEDNRLWTLNKIFISSFRLWQALKILRQTTLTLSRFPFN
jgi:hypothetical protein